MLCLQGCVFANLHPLLRIMFSTHLRPCCEAWLVAECPPPHKVAFVHLLSGISASLAGLVHENARAHAPEFARHLAFMRLHIVMPLVAAAAAPLLLVLYGAPLLWQSLAFACAILPLLAIVLVARRGEIDEAHMICVAAHGGLAMSLSLGLGAGFAAAIWLALMPFEAAMGHCRLRLRAAIAAAVVLAAAMGLLQMADFLPDVSAQGIDAALALAGFAYAGGLGLAFRDQREAAWNEARAQSARHDRLASLIGDVALRFTRTGALVSASENCQERLGLRLREISGRGFFERTQIADRPAFLKAMSDAATGQRIFLVRLRIHAGDIESPRGQFAEPVFRYIELRAAASGEGDAEVIALVRDVSELIEAHDIVAANKAANRADRDWKDRLIANVSHELRTPLNAIIGFSEVLSTQNTPQDEMQKREYAQIINASGQHLLSVVNSILDMSKIEAGSFQILPECFDLQALMNGCCDILRLKAQKAEVEIIRDFVLSQTGEIVADPRACRQILINLLSNAIKFTPEGGCVALALRSEGDHVTFCVTDTGIGIFDIDLPRLGDPFFQSQSTYDRAHDGTGLGLSVVKGLVALHGGSMSIESAPGQGTCVSVRLPRDCRQAQPKSTAHIDIVSRRPAAHLHDLSRVKKIA